MLIAFLIQDEADWQDWRKAVGGTHGKPIVHVADREPDSQSHFAERAGAIAEVETFDDEDDCTTEEADGELINIPKS